MASRQSDKRMQVWNFVLLRRTPEVQGIWPLRQCRFPRDRTLRLPSRASDDARNRTPFPLPRETEGGYSTENHSGRDRGHCDLLQKILSTFISPKFVAVLPSLQGGRDAVDLQHRPLQARGRGAVLRPLRRDQPGRILAAGGCAARPAILCRTADAGTCLGVHFRSPVPQTSVFGDRRTDSQRAFVSGACVTGSIFRSRRLQAKDQPSG